MPVSYQDPSTWRRVQDRRAHLRQGLAHAVPHSRQYLLLHARWKPACSLYWRHHVYCWYALTRMIHDDSLMISGCGRFFEGNAEEMHKALNETLAALPDDTKVYVRLQRCLPFSLINADFPSLAMNTPRRM